MRILLACAQFPPTVSGYAKVAGNLASQFGKAGHEVEMLTEGHGCVRKGRIALLNREGRAIMRSGHDVVHIIGPTPMFTEQVAVAAARFGIPSVYYVHAFAGISTYFSGKAFDLVDMIYQNTYYQFALARVTRIVSSTRDFAARLRLRTGDWSVIPNGVSDPCLINGRLTEGPGVERRGSVLRVLFVGQLRPYKGVEVLLRAVAALIKRGSEVHLVIVGEGPDRGSLEQLADALTIGPSVTFAGALSDTDLHDEYLRSDALVLPSLRGESFGIVLLEARLHGLHVIASSLDGVREVVSRIGGETVTPGDVESLTAAIAKLEPRSAHSRTLNLSLAREFSWESVGTAYLSLFASILPQPEPCLPEPLMGTGPNP